jgi:hypothetical protein
MRTWREILGVPSDPNSHIPKTDDDSDKGGNLRVLSPLSPLPRELKEHEEPGFVTFVTASAEVEPPKRQEAEAVANEWLKTLGGGKARIVPFGADQERGKSWDVWDAEQRARIFAEGRATRALASKQSVKVTEFQRLFFAQLSEISADTEAELVELAQRRGIPRECAKAFWRSKRLLRTGTG